MAFSTRARVGSETYRVLFTTCDTVEADTRARRATSWMVGIAPPPRPGARDLAGKRLRNRLRGSSSFVGPPSRRARRRRGARPNSPSPARPSPPLPLPVGDGLPAAPGPRPGDGAAAPRGAHLATKKRAPRPA